MGGKRKSLPVTNRSGVVPFAVVPFLICAILRAVALVVVLVIIVFFAVVLVAVLVTIVFCAVVLVSVGALVVFIAVFCADLLARRGALLSGFVRIGEAVAVDGGRVVEGSLVVGKALSALDCSCERP